MGMVSGLRSLSPVARRLVAMKFLTFVGMVAFYYIGILGTLAYGVGGGAWSAAWTVGICNLMQVVGSFAAGAVVDRVGPRRHFALDVTFICAASLAFIPLSGSVQAILVGAALFGFAWGFGDPIMRAYPAYLTDDLAELKVINAAMNTVIATAVVAGPLLGGAITLVAPTQAVQVIAIAGALLALVPAAGFAPARDPRAEAGRGLTTVGETGSEDVTAGLGPSAAGPTGPGPSAPAADAPPSREVAPARVGNSALAGFRALAASATLRLLAVSGFLAFFAYGAFDPLEALYYRDVLRVGVEWIGVLSSAAGVGAILGGLILMRIPSRHVNLRTFLLCLSVEGLGCVIYVGTGIVWVALAGQVILGAANGAFNPLQVTLVQVHAPLDAVGRVSAAIGLMYTCSGVLPLLVAPVIAGAIGVQGTLVASGLCVLVIPLALLALLRRRIAASVAEERSRGAHVEE